MDKEKYQEHLKNEHNISKLKSSTFSVSIYLKKIKLAQIKKIIATVSTSGFPK